MHRVDYDTIALLYDEPIRDHDPDPELRALLEARPRVAPGRTRVLDVGCGTGKQLAADASRWPNLFLLGLDRFAGMLRIAKARCPGAAWLQADGAALPLADGTFDHVTSQFSYQHVRRTPQLLSEVFRVLRSGGRLALTNIDPWASRGWLVYRFFPESLAVDEHDFVRTDELKVMMEDAGFRGVRAQWTDCSHDERLRDFLAYASQRHRASQFMTIPDADYAAGLRRIEEALGAGGDDLRVRSEIVLVDVVGDKLP